MFFAFFKLYKCYQNHAKHHIYINDLSDNLELNIKPFADPTSIFVVGSDPINTSQSWIKILIELVFGLINGKCRLIQIYQNKFKRFFFSRKINKVYHPPFLLNNSKYQQISTQKNIWGYILMKTLHSNIILLKR